MPMNIWGSGPVASGGGGGGGSGDASAANQSVQIASADTLNTNVGTTTDTQTDATVSGTLLSRVRYISATLLSVLNRLPALVSGRIPVDGSAVTQPVSATTLPLPTGAATSANQTTANASLTTIVTETTAIDNKLPVLGTQTAANSVSVTPATGTNFAPSVGLNTDTTVVDPGLPGSVISFLKGILETVLAIRSRLPAVTGSRPVGDSLSVTPAISSNFAPDALTDTQLRATPIITRKETTSRWSVIGSTTAANTTNIPANSRMCSFLMQNFIGSTVHIQIHTATPSGGAVPLQSYRLNANSTMVLGNDYFGDGGEVVPNANIVVAVSSTHTTYTAQASPNTSLTIRYLL